ncbi:aldo/keto reductase [Actinomadura viridis]|uniref:Aryl-alcohol dehydrogenase-like predicted oxidoreductase n=1 Tax=Actinomadura viridis TaxID=58110 RepID=A0A931GIU5_9ACTN|nr:aldo/keto reductase [Actinomadura viridis]MBG6088968.1 aryl-alcohol dehydrogenase-like predicted oxidoreductase [Actinomadura viridis]
MNAVRRLGMGLAALGRPAYINVGRSQALPPERGVEDLRKATWEVLNAAYAAGVRWVDAARSYGSSEDFLGGWLAERGHQDITVSSKWGYTYVGEWRLDADVHEVKEHSLGRFREQYLESRRFLGEALSVYQVHSLTEDSPLFGDLALQGALAEAAAEGLRLGFSTSGPRQAETVRRALALEVRGRRLFSTVQSTWNVLDPSVGAALREAHDQGVHVLVKEAMANGRLAVRPPRALRQVADRHGAGPDTVALAAVLSRPWADTVLMGAVSTAQLQSNLAAVNLVLDEDDLETLVPLALPPARYWQERAALPWA